MRPFLPIVPKSSLVGWPQLGWGEVRACSIGKASGAQTGQAGGQRRQKRETPFGVSLRLHLGELSTLPGPTEGPNLGGGVGWVPSCYLGNKGNSITFHTPGREAGHTDPTRVNSAEHQARQHRKGWSDRGSPSWTLELPQNPTIF